MFHSQVFSGVPFVNVFPFIAALPDIVHTIPLDDNTIALFGMLIGVTGGMFLTYYMDQLKAKKAKVEKIERKRRDR
jgi:hypothetical protein